MLPTPPMTDERRALQATVADFLNETLPHRRVAELDERREFPWDVWRGLADLGVLAIGVPEGRGGSGGQTADSMVVIMELASRFPSLAADYVLCGMVARTLDELGDERQVSWIEGLAQGREVFAYGISEPDGGTDALALTTSARQADDGSWRVTGRKMWTSMAADASRVFVLCRTDPAEPPDRRARGISLIAVPTDQPGVTIRKIHLAAMRAAGTCEVFLDEAVAEADDLLGTRGRGFHGLRGTLAVERILSAGVSLGIARGALELATDYGKQREAFGRPIGGFQAVQHPLADAATEFSAAMLLASKSIEQDDEGSDATLLSSMAKLAASECAARTVDAGMRILAGMGMAVESPMQLLFRDARLHLFSPVSNEMVRNIIGEALGLPRSY